MAEIHIQRRITRLITSGINTGGKMKFSFIIIAKFSFIILILAAIACQQQQAGGRPRAAPRTFAEPVQFEHVDALSGASKTCGAPSASRVTEYIVVATT
eukprot:SAG31_NODE_18_length_35375_cov_22.525315_23_plen_99_part_00